MKSIFKYSLFLVAIPILTSCSGGASVDVSTEPIIASGEFLFEGPNTLQGVLSIDLADLAKQSQLDAATIKAVKINALTVEMPEDSIASVIESILVQFVSDQQPLVTAGTINPNTATRTQSLEINSEVDVLPYLKDPSSTLVVDINLGGDLDYLELPVTFKLTLQQ